MRKAEVDVVIATVDISRIGPTVESLKYLPFNANLTVISGRLWEEALNEGIRRTTLDVIFIDDDARLTEDTFKNWDYYYPLADIFGFKLLFEDGRIQHAGGICKVDYDRSELILSHYGYGIKNGPGVFDQPAYVFHIGPAVGYYKRHVLDEIQFPEGMPGIYFRDVEFSFRALEKGYKILYVPNIAYHQESSITRVLTNDHNKRTSEAFAHLVNSNVEMIKYCDEKFPIPVEGPA